VLRPSHPSPQWDRILPAEVSIPSHPEMAWSSLLSIVKSAKVAHKDSQECDERKQFASPFPTGFLIVFIVAFIMAMLCPDRKGHAGWLFGLSMVNLGGLVARGLWTTIIGKTLTKDRFLMLDLVRGILLSHIMIFHVSWSLKQFGLASSMCNRMLPSDMPVLDYCLFCLAIVAGHALLIPIGLWHTPTAEVYFVTYSWTLVTTWKYWSSMTGMACMCLIAGYTSSHRFKKARSTETLQQYAISTCKHLLLLAVGALLITLVSYLRTRIRGYGGYICTGALHLLLFAALVHLPFLFLPEIAMAVGITGIILRVFKYRVWEPRSCGGFDHQSFQLGISAQLLGIGFCHIRILDPLHRLVAHKMKEWVLIWMGQNSLIAYLTHQGAIMPIAFMFASVLLPLGWRPGEAQCGGRGLWLFNTTAAI